MITSLNLKKAGFSPGGWRPLDDPDRQYRVWKMPLDSGLSIEVEEELGQNLQRSFYVYLTGDDGTFIELASIDSVTKIFELKSLLS